MAEYWRVEARLHRTGKKFKPRLWRYVKVASQTMQITRMVSFPDGSDWADVELTSCRPPEGTSPIVCEVAIKKYRTLVDKREIAFQIEQILEMQHPIEEVRAVVEEIWNHGEILENRREG